MPVQFCKSHLTGTQTSTLMLILWILHPGRILRVYWKRQFWMVDHSQETPLIRHDESARTIKEAATVSNLAGSFVTIGTRRSPTVAQVHMKCITQRSTSDTRLVDDNARIYCPFAHMLPMSSQTITCKQFGPHQFLTGLQICYDELHWHAIYYDDVFPQG